MQFCPSWTEDQLGCSAIGGFQPSELQAPLWGGIFLRRGITMKILRAFTAVPLLTLAATLVFAAAGKSATVTGYVLDSACAFTKSLDKPISRDCATACAKAGSPLVILTADGTVYWPIADSTPAVEQNTKLLPFAGQKVTAKGKVFERGGSHALVIEHIESAEANPAQ
jgi:hypothetical protein